MEKELIREIFKDAAVEASDEDMMYIFEQFENDARNRADLESYSHSYNPICSKCQQLESELKEVKKERDAYYNSVCERRGTKNVWVDNYGKVKYRY